ncbi:MAG: NADH-quinone oxidoreductase subunit NuoH [SAR202 cluster bacterium]|nr:NADH-quinone oxidoreductase subunit NuoH [SAR202 cluster bacterium]|tara:strand:- start:17620 stop:18834 length:1215 start_codon:yes stop_codon:yes gene_type:complete
MNINNFQNIINSLIPGLPTWLVFITSAILISFIVINAVVITGALTVWLERRLLARIQSRLGPNRWGPFGLFTPVADLIKMIGKEDTVPATADKKIFNLAPIVLLVPVLLVFAVIPMSNNSFLGQLNIGILFIVGVTGFNTLAVFMAAWSSRNKYALFGAMRGVAMLLSYEVPMALSIISIVLTTNFLLNIDGSNLSALSLVGIVQAQKIPFFILQPLGALIFVTAASAEMSRAPFDMIESESELGAGYHTEYSGIKFAIFQLTEFLAPVATAAIISVMFAGGIKGLSFIPGSVILVVKIFVIVLIFIWIRATWPRLRVDQIMNFAWKFLLPLSVINIFSQAIILQIFYSSDSIITINELWTIAFINWILAGISIFLLAKLFGHKGRDKNIPIPSKLANMEFTSE